MACSATLQGHALPVIALALAGSTLFTASADKTIRQFDLAHAGAPVATFQGHTDQVNCLTQTPGVLYSGGRDHTVRVWDARMTSPCVGVWAGHREQVTCSGMTPEGLVTGSDDCTVRLWDDRGGSREIDRHDERVWSLAVLGSGALVTGSAEELHVIDRRQPV